MNLVVISTRRSGTHLTIDTVLNNFPQFECKQSDKMYYDLNFETPDNIERLQDLDHCVVKTHILPQIDIYGLNQREHEILDSFLHQTPKIYVYRNGLDVMVSMYYYYQLLIPELKNKSFSQFLRYPLNEEPIENLTAPKLWTLHIESWFASDYVRERTLFLKYEDFMNDYHAVVGKIAEFLDLPMPEKVVDVRLRNKIAKGGTLAHWISEVIKKIRKLSGQKITAVMPRRGGVNEYKNYFTPQDLEYFMSIAGETMHKLGYEVDY